MISFCVVAFGCISSMIIKARKARGEVLSMWVLCYRGVDNAMHINDKIAISSHWNNNNCIKGTMEVRWQVTISIAIHWWNYLNLPIWEVQWKFEIKVSKGVQIRSFFYFSIFCNLSNLKIRFKLGLKLIQTYHTFKFF